LEKIKILVTGFPHTGTSILKSKFGECSNLHEVEIEQPFVYPQDIHNSQDKKFIIVKNPILPIDIRAGGVPFTRYVASNYYDYTIIFVIRNPWNVFTSIIKDGGNPLNNLEPNQGPQYHIKVQEYMVAAEFFLQSIENNYPNIHAIKYEDFFPNDFQKLRELMDTIGLDYTNDIFTSRSKNYKHVPHIDYKNIESNEVSYQKNRLELRTWQINQPFQNMNSEVNIPEELNKILSESEIVKKLGYSDPRITD
jgi:hypothetical protein